MQIYKYATEEEAQQIIADKTVQGLILTDVQNITEGNFLGFAENPIQRPTPIEQRIQDMQNTIDLLLLKQEGIL